MHPPFQELDFTMPALMMLEYFFPMLQHPAPEVNWHHEALSWPNKESRESHVSYGKPLYMPALM